MLCLRPLFTIAVLASVSACANDLPISKDTISQAALDAPYPELLPLDELLAEANDGSTVTEETDSIEKRLAALKARASALRSRSIFDGATRLKLIEAGQRNAARL